MSTDHVFRRCLSSYFPTYGAIFMANQSTRKECLQRKLFGLPLPFSDFVFEVKIGMLLFLYDYHKRKLYGVFEASSNGGLELVPDAYKSTKKWFPAQVRFNILWQCAPLEEDAFRDAIAENYVTRNKFNFGLSRDQVGRLLFLFEKTKLKIQRSHMSEGCHQRHKKNVSSVYESHLRSIRKLKSLEEVNDNNNNPERNLPQTGCGQGQDVSSLTLMETLPKSMPKKLASLAICDPKVTADLELPSLEPTETEDLLLHESFLKPGICSSGPQNLDAADIDEPNDDRIRYQTHDHDDEKNRKLSGIRVRGLHSNNREKRISVFQRLAGWPKVIEEKSGSCSENMRVILNKLDKKHKIWQNECTQKPHLCHEGSDSRMAAKSEPRERVSGTNIRSLKRKTSSTVKTFKDDKRTKTLAGKHQKRKHVQESKACKKISLVPDLSQGSSAITVDDRRYEAPCKPETSTIAAGDAGVTKEAPLTKPFICEDSVDDKLYHQIGLEASCQEDPVEMLLAEYNEYLSRSRIEVQNVYLENCTVGVGEGLHEFYSS